MLNQVAIQQLINVQLKEGTTVDQSLQIIFLHASAMTESSKDLGQFANSSFHC